MRPLLKGFAAVVFALALSRAALAQAPATVPAPAPTKAAEDSEAKKAEGYARVRDEADGNVVLELASRTFAKKGEDAAKSPRVTLVSAVHVADRAFYEARQKLLDACTVVLFEGVRPPGTGAIAGDATDAQRAAATRGRMEFLKGLVEAHRQRQGSYPRDFDDLIAHADKRWTQIIEAVRVDAWGQAIRLDRVDADLERKTSDRVVLTSVAADGAPRRDDTGELRVEVVVDPNALGAKDRDPGLQLKLANAFGLVFQPDVMDTSKANWRSSDMSIDQLTTRLDEAGADASTLLGALDGSSMIARFAGLILDMIGSNKQTQAMAKVALIEMLGATEGSVGGGGFGGGAMARSMKKMMKVIVEDRNAVVLSDIRGLVEGPNPPETIAVFYGAGHMEDLERRLHDELGYEPVETTWAIAIRAEPKEAGLTPAQAKMMRDMMRKMMDAQK